MIIVYSLRVVFSTYLLCKYLPYYFSDAIFGFHSKLKEATLNITVSISKGRGFLKKNIY